MTMRFRRRWDFEQSNRPIFLNDLRDDTDTQEAIEELLGDVAGELIGTTVDTGATYKLILFSNQTVKAIPLTAADPLPPTGLAADVKLSSIKLTWTAAAFTGSKTYQVYRDGTQVASTTSLSYRDLNIGVGATYAYKVRTVDAYSVPSEFTDVVTAFLDPALNSPPVVTVTAWPPNPPTNGKTLLRVCASDVDAQQLSLTLGVDIGTLAATDDPSIWYYTP